MERDYMKLVFVGHIDHGKSTLIGRLLYDTGSLPEDKVEEVRRTCEALGREMEYGFVLDHLQEEREQGITIDTAQIFFETDKRSYVIIDAPGHVEFVRNMITGASQAEAAILIIDASEGVKEQTKRHAFILGMLGIRQVIVVINKMDKAGYSEDRFGEVKADILSFLKEVGLTASAVIPIVARDGDNILKMSEKMSWYSGDSLLTSLDNLRAAGESTCNALRFPVQDVYRMDDKRIYVGRLESGLLKTGDEVIVLPAGTRTGVASIEKFGEDPKEAYSKESIGITTADALFIERGDVLCLPDDPAIVTDTLNANIFWMMQEDLNRGERLNLKLATQEVTATVEEISKRIDSSTLETIESNADVLKNNEVGQVRLKTGRRIVVDDYNNVPELGRFVLEKNGVNSAGGIITCVRDEKCVAGNP